MAKYDLLETYLRRCGNAEFELGFAELERIIGSALPGSALRPQWWVNGIDPDSTHVQCRS